jgi:hypothetical protein
MRSKFRLKRPIAVGTAKQVHEARATGPGGDASQPGVTGLALFPYKAAYSIRPIGPTMARNDTFR